MKVIEFKYQDREILRHRPSKRINLIGRASNCEIVLRHKEIQPVHFVLEWVGEGEFDEDSGQWVLVDVTGKDKADRDVGLGIVLKDKPLQLGKYSVRMVQDALTPTDLQRGVLSRNISDMSGHKQAASAAIPNKGDYSAEIITFSKSLDEIVNVEHFQPLRANGRLSPFRDLKNVQFIWNKKNRDLIFIENSGESVDFKLKNVRASEAVHLGQGKKYEIKRSDFVFVETNRFRYFVRIVPQLQAHTEFLSWFKDKTFLATLILLVGLVWLFRVMPPYQPGYKEPATPPRVARIEIQQDPPPAPVPEKPLEPQAMATPEPPKVTPEEAKAVVETPPSPPSANNAKAPPATVVNSKNHRPQMGLNATSPVKNVNSVGILGKLKSTQAATAKINAKDIADTSVNDMAVANKGIVINQPQMGTLESGTKDSKALASASTTLKNSQSAQVGVHSKMGLSDASSKLNSTLSKSSKNLGAALGSSEGVDVGSDVDISGGLDKESVRRAIRENKKSLANCFESGLLKKKSLGGRITLRWKITPEGPVENIAVQSTTTGLASFDECVTRVLKGIVFPKAPNKQPSLVTYPIQFQERK